MADPGDGTWRQRRLGMELRRLREERDLGPHTAAALLGRTESSLSKLENAQRGIRKPALEQILDKYQVTDVIYPRVECWPSRQLSGGRSAARLYGSRGSLLVPLEGTLLVVFW